EQVVAGLRHPGQQRPDDRRVVAGGDAELDVPVADLRVLGGDRDVGEKSGDGARAYGHAVDGRDDGLLAVDDVVDQVRHLGEHVRDRVVVAGDALDHREVAPGG